MLTALAGVVIASSSLAIQWTLLLLWLGGTVASIACILRRARQSGEPPTVRLLFDAPPASEGTTADPPAAVADRRGRPAAEPGTHATDQRPRQANEPGTHATDQRPRQANEPRIAVTDQRCLPPNAPGIRVADQRPRQPTDIDPAVTAAHLGDRQHDVPASPGDGHGDKRITMRGGPSATPDKSDPADPGSVTERP